jgi:hypothetical protein
MSVDTREVTLYHVFKVLFSRHVNFFLCGRIISGVCYIYQALTFFLSSGEGVGGVYLCFLSTCCITGGCMYLVAVVRRIVIVHMAM